MKPRRLSQLLVRTTAKELAKNPKLSAREELIVEAFCKSRHFEVLDEASVDTLLNEPSSGDPERDEFKEIVRKLLKADSEANF